MRKVMILASGMLSLGFDAYVLAGLLPKIGETFQVSASQTGQVVSVFTLCYALAAPALATFLAGNRVRRTLILALCIFTIGNGLSAVAPSFAVLLIARAMAGIGAGVFSPMAVAAAASLVNGRKRGRALGLTMGGMSVGTVIGVPLGLTIAENFGWHSTLWVVTVLGGLATVGLILWFPNVAASPPPSLKERVAILVNKRVATTVAITFMTGIASLGLYTYIVPILQGARITYAMPFLWTWGIGGVVGSLLIGTLIDRTGRPAHLMASILFILSGVIFVLRFSFNTHLLLFLLFVLWGAMGWASQAPQQHVLLSVEPKNGSTAVALNSSAVYLGSSVGSCLGGVAISGGLLPCNLPIALGTISLIALVAQIAVISRNRSDHVTVAQQESANSF